jgi:hypothetical protein
VRYVTLETGTPCASEPTGARKGATLILVSRTDQSRKGIAPNHRCGSTDVKRYWDLVKRVANAWIDDHVPSMGAALAYYTLFSLAPLLLIVTAVAGLVFGREAARGEIQAQLSSLMGERGAGVVQDLLASVDQPAESTAAAMLGVVLLLIVELEVLFCPRHRASRGPAWDAALSHPALRVYRLCRLCHQSSR